MPELPEIHNLAKQMDRTMRGLVIESVEVTQPKCLNVSVKQFGKLTVGRAVGRTTKRGKWIFAELAPGSRLLANLGMGGDLLYHAPGWELPEKYQVALYFEDGAALTFRFWWFGCVHAVREADLPNHKLTASLGVDPLDKREFTWERFRALLDGRRGAVKPFLLNQSSIAGIGNVYIQDMLWLAGLHPKRTIPSLSEEEKRRLHAAIVEHLSHAARLGGFKGERNLYGKPGRFWRFRVGYRDGEDCPACGATIEKIKTGGTSSYICPTCQPL